MQIDHLVYACRDLDVGLDDVEALTGERPSPGGQHVGFGTRNYLLDLGGGTYLEVIGPDPHQGDPVSPRPFGLDDLSEDRLVAWAVRSHDIESDIVRLAHEGVDLGSSRSMERATPDGTMLHWRLTAPRAGVVPFLIDWGDSLHPTKSLQSPCELQGLRIESPDLAIIKPIIRTFDVEVDLRPGFEDRLAATIDTPLGRVVLW